MDIQTFDFNDLTNQENVFGEQKSNSSVDERFYRLKRDENGNGAAIIRFLPDPNMCLMQQIFRINVNNQKGAEKRWVNELSPQNINERDPFHELWSSLWRAGKRDEARKFARQTRYFTNILVVNDPAAPENNGKIFLLDISQSLKQMLSDAMFPSETERSLGAVPKKLFNPLQGNNFKLVSKKGPNGFINYDSSSVAADETAVFSTREQAIETIKSKCYALNEFLKPEAYKTYDELSEKLKYVTFQDDPPSSSQPTQAATTAEVVDPIKDLANEAAALDNFLESV